MFKAVFTEIVPSSTEAAGVGYDCPINLTTVVAKATSAGWVPSKAKAFRYTRSCIENNRVESCCNNKAMRLELKNLKEKGS